MVGLGRVTTYFRLFRRSATVILGSSRHLVARKPGKWKHILYSSLASVTFGGGLCAIPFRQADDLSHDSLIKRAASLATDSSSTFLSQATLALIHAITEYSKAVHTLIALQRRYLDSLGNLSPAEEDTIWQVIIGQRSQVNERRDECKRFESTWVSAVTLCDAAAEAAYTSGAEHASITIRTNIHLAQTQVEQSQKLSADADKKLTETKVMEIERMAQHAASSDEEEVPDAYLRED